MISLLTVLATMLLQGAPAAASPSPAPDYADPAVWLCRPGRADACGADLTATVIKAGGARTTETFKPARDPAIDCFYVYPTISFDPTPNSDLSPGPEERAIVQSQAARFGQVCRVFAPVYRQVTLYALMRQVAGKPVAMDVNMPYDDIKSAWNSYVAHDNQSRGVVLIGHSQGALILKKLLAEEIDGKPAGALLVSAMIIGTPVAVPTGKDVGGDFKSTPLCRSRIQAGCVINYSSFRAGAAPPASSFFGRVPGAGLTSGCTNPSALEGGLGLAHPYFSAGASALPGTAPVSWAKTGPPVITPFVSTPGLISTQCMSEGGATWLAVTVNPDPAGVRTDQIVGDTVAAGQVLKEWGLHNIDVNLELGDLMALADSQGKAWRRGRR